MAVYYEKSKSNNFKKIVKFAGGGFIILGLCFLAYFFLPVILYQVFLSKSYASASIESPIPKYLVVGNNGNIKDLIAQGINSLTADYTDARNWYPNIANSQEEKPKIEKYTLSIPKIKVENAEVSTIDYDLEKHLIQYLGTSIPGEKGTAVIFGHSTLPQLFDAKNYKTIFAYAHTLKEGDEIFATVNGITYKYKIFSIIITDPEDTNMLSQSYDHSYITIVTCTPPGTIWKRLIVRASLDSVVN